LLISLQTETGIEIGSVSGIGIGIGIESGTGPFRRFAPLHHL